MLRIRMEKIGFRPLHGGIVAKIELMSTTASGKVMLASAQMNPFIRVVAVGSKVTEVKEGDWCLMNPGVQPMPFIAGDGRAYFMMKEYDVIGVYDHKPSEEMVAMVLDNKIMQSAISRDNTKFIDPDVVSSLRAKKNKWKNADISDVESAPPIIKNPGKIYN